MKFAYLASFLVLLVISCSKNPIHQSEFPNNSENMTSQNDFIPEWNTIDSLEAEGLVKSALVKVEELSNRTEMKNNPAQIIKSSIYQNKYLAQLEEDGFEHTIQRMEEMLAKTQGVTKSILQSILGELYSEYLQRNLYRIQNRSDLGDGIESDIFSWPASKILERSNQLYIASIQHSAASNLSLEGIKEIILNNTELDAELCPNVYSFLMVRALDHFTNREIQVSDPVNAFVLDDPVIFADLNEFLEHKYETEDSLSFQFQIILLYQEFLKYLRSKERNKSLAYFNLERIKYAYRQSQLESKEERFKNALESFIANAGFKGIFPLGEYELALFYYNQGLQYGNNFQQEYRPLLVRSHKIIDEVLASSPDSVYAPVLKNLLGKIEAKELNIQIEKVQPPGHDFLSYIRYRNIDKVYFKLVEIDDGFYDKINGFNPQQIMDFFSDKTGLRIWSQSLNSDDYNAHATELPVEGLPLGQYVLIASDDPNFKKSNSIIQYGVFQVSSLAYRFISDRRANIVLVQNRVTGTPVTDVKVELYKWQYRANLRKNELVKISEHRTDNSGVITISSDEARNVMVKLTAGNDILDLRQYHYINRSVKPQVRSSAMLFTDRNIYRPGQTIYFKALALSFDQNNIPKIITHTSITARLFDANNQEVSKIPLVTNEFGTANANFNAPSTGLYGSMRIELEVREGRRSQYIRVEEYKRPKFEVVLQSPEYSYQLEDTVIVSGDAKMLAGVPLDHARVRYRVSRQAFYPNYYSHFRSYFPPQAMRTSEIAHGLLNTGPNGHFEIKFQLIPDGSIPKDNKPRFRYVLSVDIIDITGEVQTDQLNLVAGYDPFFLDVDLEEAIDISSGKRFVVNTTNAAGVKVKSRGSIKWIKLENPGKLLRDKYWNKTDTQYIPEPVFRERFSFDKYGEYDEVQFWKEENLEFEQLFAENIDDLEIPQSIQAGVYKLLLTATDDTDNEVEAVRYIAVTNFEESIFPPNRTLYIKELKSAYLPGEKVVLEIGSPDPEIPFFIEIEKKGGFTSKRWLNLKKESQITIPISEDDRGNFMLHVSCMYNSRLYSESLSVAVPWTNKNLEIEYVRFQDKLIPGSSEEWQIIIKGKKKDQLGIEVLASMYDASLDLFGRANLWRSAIYPSYSSYRRSYAPGFNAFNLSVLSRPDSPGFLDFSSIYSTPLLNWFKLNEVIGYFPQIYYTREPSPVMKRNLQEADGAEIPATAEESSELEGNLKIGDHSSPDDYAKDNDFPFLGKRVRSDFNETTFFFPDLKTDDDGNIILSFQVRDALTRWRFQLFAHTTELEYAFSEREVLTQKDLMVFPNPPRFLREKDEIYFPVKLSNLTDQDLSTIIKLEFFDAETNRTINKDLEHLPSPQEVIVNAQGSSSIRWKVKVPQEMQGIIKYRISAISGNLTDIEENILPVLSNRSLVTESFAFDVNAGELKKLRFDDFSDHSSSSLSHHSYSLEFTSHPVWLAIQALPYMMEVPNECSELIFSRFYANSLALKISNSHPRIKEVFDRWRKYEGDVLLSNLQKNEDLKSALLEETPWILQAKTEEAQKKNIALLFDLNKMSHELNQSSAKLAEIQLSNGGFSWFRGGRDNRYITQYILEGLGHLKKMNAWPSGELSRILDAVSEKGIRYADQRFLEDFERWSKADDEQISYMDLHYLYVRSYFNYPISEDVGNAAEVMIKKLKEHWLKKSIYGQALGALVIHRTGDNFARDMMKSIAERAIRNSDLGTYWKQNTGFYWYQLPIERQSLLIEAFYEIAEDETIIAEMQKWLLKNKQTNHWPTSKSTASAIYALLLNPHTGALHTDWIESAAKVEIKVGDEIVSGVDRDSGSGYFRKNWEKSEIKRELGRLEIYNPGNTIAWGALYWQYFEDLDKIARPTDSELNLEKTVFKEIYSDTGPKLIPVNDQDLLRVGDRVKVRIKITVDRPMEFVHMKDMRASGFEPVNVFSQYKWQATLGYYESTRDMATHFYFGYLPRGTHVFEYPLRVIHEGNFSNGIATIQCFYAPEFSGHSEGIRIRVQENL